MFTSIRHKLRLRASLKHEAEKRVTRSPQWPALEKRIIMTRAVCAGCGTRVHLQVHHIQPFHLHPELELDEKNLLVLCMDVPECHLRIGHGDNFKAWNPVVEAHALASRTDPAKRKTIWAEAKRVRKT